MRAGGGRLSSSIAAGVTGSPGFLEWLDYPAPVVRTMPNTPALLGCGATALYANEAVTEEQREAAETILESAGIALWVDDEGLLDAVTAVSGSGPAYYFLLMEHMIRNRGAPRAQRKPSAALSPSRPRSGRRAWPSRQDGPRRSFGSASPRRAGTTERALDLFREGGFGRAWSKRALTGARDRSRELGG